MTREAIEYFKFHRKIFCEDHLKNCPKDSLAYQATLKEKEFYDMAIKALEQEPRWIHVKNRLPMMGQDVLICDYDGDMYISYLHTDGKWGYDDAGNKLKNIIAWMPLPEPYGTDINVGSRK